MFSRISHTLWGNVSREEAQKFGFLASIFFFIVGAYWMLREMKNALFMHIVGPTGIPYAKMITIISMIILVLFYGKLVDLCKRTTLIYILSSLYGLLFLSFAYFLTHPVIGMANVIPNFDRIFGWVMYVTIESYGSLICGAAFWSFVASIMDTTTAKKGYPIIVSGAQLGSILGSALLMTQASRFGLPLLMVIAAICVLTVPVMLKLFSRKHAADLAFVGAGEKKRSTGALEGLRLLLSKPYLMGILVVSTVYEIITTIFDLLMNVSAKQTFGSTEKVTEFLGLFGVATNSISFLFALIGTSFFIRRFGLTTCLVLYPLVIACLVSGVWAWPCLWMFFIAQIATKGLGYALNNPCKEIMYIPTSKDVKFKAKSWVDVQGGRSAKGIGSVINASFPLIADLVVYGSIISLGVIALWIPIALFVGRTNNTLVQEGKIIE